jgi:hypothetical protein
VPCLRQRSAPRASRGGASATAAGRFSSERRRVSRRAQLPGHSLVHKLEIGIMRRAPEPQQRSGCRLQCGCPRPAEEALGPRSAARQHSGAAHGKLPPLRLSAAGTELQPPAVRLALSSLVSPYALRGWRCCRRAARLGTQHKGNGAGARTRERRAVRRPPRRMWSAFGRPDPSCVTRPERQTSAPFESRHIRRASHGSKPSAGQAGAGEGAASAPAPRAAPTQPRPHGHRRRRITAPSEGIVLHCSGLAVARRV